METAAYEELLHQEGRIITHVVGRSMLPLLYDRESIVIVESADRIPPGRGDVVLYKAGNRYLLHRILEIREEEYLIRGDNTQVMEHVPKETVLATLTGFYRHPESRLVTRNDISYRMYCTLLPCIRMMRKNKNRIKNGIRRFLR